MELAIRLASTGEAERAALLAEHSSFVGVDLACTLKALFYDTRTRDRASAAGAAAALRTLAAMTEEPEVQALAAWIGGIAVLEHDGRAEQAIEELDRAAELFKMIGQSHTAAATQVGKLHALAMLGRYDEAIACGLGARDVLLAHDDLLTTGKIEQNLGNIYHRRDCYEQAERLYCSARERFLALDDQRQLVQVDNGLANLRALQHKFREATVLYEQALARSQLAGLEVTHAEIECNLGCLALFQGRYDRALDYLERSRRRYVALDLPHRVLLTEQELADAYLELNLASQAQAIYARIIPELARLGLRAEQARALAYHGHARRLLGEMDEASRLLAHARALYAAEGNTIGEAMTVLAEAQLHYAVGNHAAVEAAAAQAEAPLVAAGTIGRALLARWLRGEAARALGQDSEAKGWLESALRDAEAQMLPQVAYRCSTSLGLLAASSGDSRAAELSFRRAVALIEDLRAPLPAEEFRTAFVADKLTPYTELVRLCLADSGADRAVEALNYVERARSRALLDMLGGSHPVQPRPRDRFEAQVIEQLAELREELNWYYSQINRLPDSEGQHSAAAVAELHRAVRQRESALSELTRQLQQRAEGPAQGVPFQNVEPLDIARLQHDLGAETALIEYFSIDGELLAFVVTSEQVEVVRDLGREEQAEEALRQLRFQIDALRYGSARLHTHLEQLAVRSRRYLGILYDLLLRPLAARLNRQRLVVVPHRALHYVPFHALHDGEAYVIEHHEICYAPSASVLGYCLARPARRPRQALLLGISDARTPRVHDEIIALAPLFPKAVALLDDQATLGALRELAPTADILHLACHGYFRPDDPLFSSLQLADGWLTAREAYDLELRCGLVVLSACETGMNTVAPGDELIGMARGFFSAGTPSLLASLWTVDDAATARLMVHFYTRLQAGDGPAAALRYAQCELLKQHPHPFFWSPFVLLGRW